MSRILIVRLGSLGDLVHTLPAVAAIRRANPDARIDWLVDSPHREFLELVPILSSLVVLRGRGVRAWLDVRRELRRGELARSRRGLVYPGSSRVVSACLLAVSASRRSSRSSSFSCSRPSAA